VLFDAIRAVSRGRRFLDPSVQALMVQAIRADLDRPVARAISLTPRERRVLELVALGMTNPQIATALRVSTSTVKQCVSQVLQKLGVANRAGAVNKAVSEGLLAGS